MSTRRWRESIPLWAIIPVAICLSAAIGWADFHANEVQGTVLVLLLVSAALSFVAPREAWIIAVILGLSVFGVYAVARLFHVSPTYPVNAPPSTLLAMIPSAIGAACGYAARAAIRTPPRP